MATPRPTPDLRVESGAESRRSSTDRRRRPGLVGPIAALLVGLALTGCVGEPPEVTVDDPELVAGRSVYASSCASCHGSSGGGGSGTRLADGAVVEAYPDIGDQITLVREGRGRMPSYGGRLSEDQIRAVVRYTREVL